MIVVLCSGRGRGKTGGGEGLTRDWKLGSELPHGPVGCWEIVSDLCFNEGPKLLRGQVEVRDRTSYRLLQEVRAGWTEGAARGGAEHRRAGDTRRFARSSLPLSSMIRWRVETKDLGFRSAAAAACAVCVRILFVMFLWIETRHRPIFDFRAQPQPAPGSRRMYIVVPRERHP